MTTTPEPDEILRDFLAAEHLRLSKPEHPEPRQNPMLANYLGGIQAALDHLRTLRLNAERAHHPDCPALRFTDRPDRCRCLWLAALDTVTR